MYFSQKWFLFKSPKANKYHCLIFSHNPEWNPLDFFYQSQGGVQQACVCVWPCIVKGWCVFAVQVHALWFQNSLWGFGVLILRSHSWTLYRGAAYGGKRAGNRAWRSKAGWRKAGRKKRRVWMEQNRINRGELNDIESSICRVLAGR